MFKSRLYTPKNCKSYTSKTSAHIQYIASRPGVLLDKNLNALFGNIDGSYNNSIELEKGQAVATQAAESRKTTYREVISFTDEQAKHLNLNTLEDWKEYVKKQVLVIAREQGIPFENLKWEAAIHYKEGHPHAHIILWNNLGIQKTFLPKEFISKVRRKLIQSTYSEEFKEFFKKQNLEKNNVRADSKKYFQKFEDNLAVLYHLGDDDIETFDVSGLASGDIKKSDNYDKIVFDWLELRQAVRHYNGSLKYQYLPQSLKAQTDDYVKLLISSNGELKNITDKFVNAHIEVFQFYSAENNEIKEQVKKYSQEAVKMIANQLLQSMKYFEDKVEKKTQAEISDTDETEQTEAEKNTIQQIDTSIISAFGNLAHITRQSKAHAVQMRQALSDLSKQAKIEKAKESKDRGLGM